MLTSLKRELGRWFWYSIIFFLIFAIIAMMWKIAFCLFSRTVDHDRKKFVTNYEFIKIK